MNVAIIWHRILFALLIVSLQTYLITAKADSKTENEENHPPINNEGILHSLRDVISHGDLADEQYYEKKFGVVLKSNGVGEVYDWGQACGRIRTGRTGEYFNNVQIPWYFNDQHQFLNKCGGFPYRKEFLPNGRIRVVAFIYINTDITCITQENIAEQLENLNYTHGPYQRDFLYFFPGRNSIGLAALASGARKCIAVINLFQNQNGANTK